MFKRISAGFALVLALAFAPSAAQAACDNNIWALDVNGNLWLFDPPSQVTATQAPGNPKMTFGTIARGVYSGDVYDIPVSGSNVTLSRYDPVAKTTTNVGTFPNSSALFASGFAQNGLGYVVSTSEAFSYTDANPSTITRLPAPTVASGPPLSSFNAGDLAFDIAGNGWIVLSTGANSYVYEISFTPTQTLFTNVTQLTLNGSNYAGGDLYSMAYGADGNLYASAYNSKTLYQINQYTGVMTSFGSQGVALDDFASCPFGSLAFLKTAPTYTATGEAMTYVLTATNSATSPVTGIQLSDPVPSGVTVNGATCNPAAACSTITSGQTVTATFSVGAASSTSVSIDAADASLPLGTSTNTATFNVTGQFAPVSAKTTVLANIMKKTVQDITTKGPVGNSTPSSPGDLIEYVLTYTNYSNGPLTFTKIIDSVPANTTYYPSSAVCVSVPNALACTPPSGPDSNGNLTWTFTGSAGSFAPFNSITVKFRVTVN